jgi:hypothetical protein
MLKDGIQAKNLKVKVFTGFPQIVEEEVNKWLNEYKGLVFDIFYQHCLSAFQRPDSSFPETEREFSIVVVYGESGYKKYD